MTRIYYAALICVAFFCCFATGVAVGRARCNARVAVNSYEHIVQNVKQSGDINETVLHTNLGDIRRILREKYTIAE